MLIKLKPFPVVTFNVRCAQHKCAVEIHVEGSRLSRNRLLIGGSVTSLRCEEGGPQCSNDWHMFVNSPGAITIE